MREGVDAMGGDEQSREESGLTRRELVAGAAGMAIAAGVAGVSMAWPRPFGTQASDSALTSEGAGDGVAASAGEDAGGDPRPRGYVFAPTDGEPGRELGQGIRGMWGVVRTYSTGVPMVDRVVVEYDGDVDPALADSNPASAFSFTDGDQVRDVVEVAVSAAPDAARGDASQAGRYVTAWLRPEENPDPSDGQAWRSTTSGGVAVTFEGERSVFRLDFASVDVEQLVDVVGADGSTLRPAGALPGLRRQDLVWSQHAGFSVDEVFSGQTGDVHYSWRAPLAFDESATSGYALMVALPGYNGLLLSDDDRTRGVNAFCDLAVVTFAQADPQTFVLAPQVRSWDEASAQQVIELVEAFLVAHPQVDATRVHGAGYSGGGETMSRVVAERPELFASYLHGSSQWDGSFETVAQAGTAVYVLMAQSDEYYGSERAEQAAQGLRDAYAAAGADDATIDSRVVLDLRSDAFCNSYGAYYYHGGAQCAYQDPALLSWLLRKARGADGAYDLPDDPTQAGDGQASGDPAADGSATAASGRILVAYFSRAGENNYGTDTHVMLDVGYTQTVAGYISDFLGCDSFKIQEADPYPVSYSDTVARNVQEQRADARPAIANLADLPDISGYDTILVGSPIWNVRPPMIMRTFLESYDFAGKTVAPFVTYDMSGLGQTVSDYVEELPDSMVVSGDLAVYEKDAQTEDGRAQARDWLVSLGLLDPGADA